ncbi:MAG: hypothetical protein R3D26_09700 [Cyanobacteriota/Melainabacteria group bacterium]
MKAAALLNEIKHSRQYLFGFGFGFVMPLTSLSLKQVGNLGYEFMPDRIWLMTSINGDSGGFLNL